jgi:hypothetical protein
MEDFVKVIIWIIIIISFFISIFKKKNKEKPKAVQKPQRDPEQTSHIPSKIETEKKSVEGKEEIDSYDDMLAEIENLFKKGDSENYTSAKISQQNDTPKTKTTDKTKIQEHDERKKSDQFEQQWHKQTASEHTLIDDWEKEGKALEKKAAVDFNIEKNAKKFEDMLSHKKGPIGIFKHTINEKLRHPETLKDYILMSEIIGKPKAKRR